MSSTPTPPDPTTPPTPPSGGPPPVGVPDFLNTPGGPNIPSNKDERLWATIIHISGMFCGVILPLILWLVKREGSPFIDDQGKEATNFGITAFIASIGLVIVVAIIHFLAILWPLFALAVWGLSILAAIKANSGVVYRHPFTLRLIK